jgi:hypothetical protein
MNSKFSEIKKNIKWADGSIPRVTYLLSALSVVHIWMGVIFLIPFTLFLSLQDISLLFIFPIVILGILLNYSINYSILNKKKWVYYFYSVIFCFMASIAAISLLLFRDGTAILSAILYGLLLIYFVFHKETREYFNIIKQGRKGNV